MAVGSQPPVKLLCVTANVLSLAPRAENEEHVSHRRFELSASFHDKGASVVGVQESKCPNALVRHTDHYLMFGTCATSPPTGAPQGGVEIWFHVALGIRQADVFVLVSEPRLLLARAPVAGRQVLFLAGHGPTATTLAHEISAFWEHTGALLAEHRYRSGHE